VVVSSAAIRVDKLGKRYAIGELQRYKTLRDRLTRMIYAPLRLSSAGAHEKQNHIWALKDVSFEIGRGEAVGIIGHNGAGKSTLLKILSRITEPTEGWGEIRGRVGSLLEVGTGFHPELTGRENIYLNAAILGMKKQEIRNRFDDIVSFAEIERFVDTPVKHYSSGMYVRLAFAVAAHLEPEILLVDEVLAVGDATFQKKCLGRMGEVTREGRTVVFVSHNMGAVRSLCDRAILIQGGRAVLDGDPSSVISAYMSALLSKAASGEVTWQGEDAPGLDELKLRAVGLVGPGGSVSSTFEVDKPIRVEIRYEIKRPVRGMRLWFFLLTAQGEIAFASSDHERRDEEALLGQYRSTCIIPGGLLNIGQYVVRIGGDIPGAKALLPAGDYLTFYTAGVGNQGTHYPAAWPGVVCPKLEWIVEKIE
jgi:lipopolysaccharide transport system ATP-binding protein